MSVRSIPSGSPASPRSASSRWMRAASASGTPVSRGIAPRIEVTPACQLDSGKPRRVELVVLRRRAEVPEHRVALARQQHAARALVARPLADVRARDVADVVLVEEQHRAERRSPAATPAPSPAARSGAWRSRSAAPSRRPSSRRARRCSWLALLPRRSRLRRHSVTHACGCSSIPDRCSSLTNTRHRPRPRLRSLAGAGSAHHTGRQRTCPARIARAPVGTNAQ